MLKYVSKNYDIKTGIRIFIEIILNIAHKNVLEHLPCYLCRFLIRLDPQHRMAMINQGFSKISCRTAHFQNSEFSTEGYFLNTPKSHRMGVVLVR